MGRYIRKYRIGGSEETPKTIRNIGRPPMSEFIDIPQGNPNRRPNINEQMNLNQDSILNNQKQIIQQLQLNNQLIESQNKLLENQNKLTSMTNSVRKLKTSDPGPKGSPKKYGGAKKLKKGKELLVFSGNGYMRKGGSK